MANVEKTYEAKRPRNRVFLVAFLCAAGLIFLGILSTTMTQAYAVDPQEAQQEMNGSGSASSGISSESDNTAAFDRQDAIDAQTNHAGNFSNTFIPDSDVPLASGFELNQSADMAGGGSYVNAIIAALCLILLIAVLVMLFARKTKDYRVIVVRTAAAAFGIVALAVWALLDRMQVPSTPINENTLLLAVLLGVVVALMVASYVLEARLLKQASAKN